MRSDAAAAHPAAWTPGDTVRAFRAPAGPTHAPWERDCSCGSRRCGSSASWPWRCCSQRAPRTRRQDTLAAGRRRRRSSRQRCSCRSSGSRSASSCSSRAGSSTSRSATVTARAATGCRTQIHGNTRLEIGWTILPAVVLAVVMVPTVGMIWDLARAAERRRAQHHGRGPPVVVGVRVHGRGHGHRLGRPITTRRHDGDPDRPRRVPRARGERADGARTRARCPTTR